MATAKPIRFSQPPRSLVRRFAPWLALATGAALLWFWQPIHARAQASAAYAARVGCSCRHIAGRPLADCRRDFPSAVSPVWLGEDADAKSVTARVPLLAVQTATFRAGEGCVLERWTE